MESEIDFTTNRVDYKKSSKQRSLFIFDHYITPNRLVKGNSKLYNILIFDLPAVETCLNCNDCKDKCYAKKASVQYVDVRIFRDSNLQLFLSKRELLKELLILQLSNSKETTIRIHASGDFFSQDYIDFWNDIIKLFPLKKFYAYTKVSSLLDFSDICKLGNFNLIDSIINDIHLNFGDIDYCNSLNQKYGTFICPATKKGTIEYRCGLNCSYCVTNKNVCFIQH